MFQTRGKFLLGLFLTVLLIASSAVAQETTASLQGTVKDPNSAVIAKAVVELTSPALIGVKKVETDASGYYRFMNLPPGAYTITVKASGFATLKRENIDLSAGRMPTLDLAVKIGGEATTVEVKDEAPLIDVASSKIGVVASQEIIEGVPKGRSFQSMINFAPGARQEPLQSANRVSNGFSVDGASDGENTYMVEGMDTTDAYAGGIGRQVPMEFVQEVQIKSGGFEAEFGGAMGGVVNVVQKRGSNNWHGSLVAHLRSDLLASNDACGNLSIATFTSCGLRTVPGTASSGRFGAPVEYYKPMQDSQTILEPGFTVGGAIKQNKLWLFTSYMPSLDTTRRTVNFTYAGLAGPRAFTQNLFTQNALTRLDWAATDKIRLYSAWQYGFQRQTGTSLPNPDPVDPTSQINTSAANDPRQYRADYGSVLPNSVFNFGSDITLTSKLVATVRYGYWFSNNRAVGRPVGIRYQYQNNTPATGLGGVTYPAAYVQSSGYQNMPSNSITVGDAFKRKTLSSDASYFTRNVTGAHSFKFGYANNKIDNDNLARYQTAFVEIFPGQVYPNAVPGSCDSIIADNVAAYGIAANAACRGVYGYYTVSDYRTGGKVSSTNHAFYLQDAWTMGRVTLNLGVRFEKEYVPPYTAGAPDISFGFVDKAAPRLGGAWDVLGNGKLKLFAGYSRFFDVMKYSLPRGSFGGEYWHDCTYTLDNPDYTKIQATGCPTSGAATGTVTGRFIENFNFRSVTLNQNDPGVDPNLKPMRQSEASFGADYALTPTLGLELRYSHKNLDRTVEDVGVLVPGNELYYIGNPGYGTVANLLQRTTYDSSDPEDIVAYAAQCPTCPLSPKAIRVYDGLEVRVTKRSSDKWFGSISYLYSNLRGNYSGLTSSDINDASSANTGAGGGRHNPNVSRAFDMPFMQYDAHGKEINGPLGTDRPHTLKLFGWYRLKWLGMETLFGMSQLAYSGTPVGTCVPMFSSPSSCQFVEGRGNWVNFTQNAAGDYVVSSIIKNHRTPAFTQTDLNLQQEFKVSKTNEAMRFAIMANVSNLFNQQAVLSYNTDPVYSTGYLTFANGPTWSQLTSTGWDYTSVLNGQGKTFNNAYGKANLFQQARNIRLSVRFTF